jgi:hypothetical protein
LRQTFDVRLAPYERARRWRHGTFVSLHTSHDSPFHYTLAVAVGTKSAVSVDS